MVEIVRRISYQILRYPVDDIPYNVGISVYVIGNIPNVTNTMHVILSIFILDIPNVTNAMHVIIGHTKIESDI